MRQRGFTLLEILVSMAIIGLLAVPMAGAIGQTIFQTDENSTRIRALVSMENAGRSLGKDIRIAQDTGLATSTSDTTLELTWTDWTDASQYDEYSAGDVVYKRYRATYALSGDDLERTLDVCDDWNTVTLTCDELPTPWATSTTTIAASPVSSVSFTRGTGDLIIIVLTSAPKGPGFPSETRSYRVRGSILMAPAPA